MGSRRRIEAAALGAALAVVALASTARAHEAPSEESAPVPCALIESYAGDVRLLDASRSRLLNVAEKAGVPCGGWLSIAKGSAQLRHRDGFRIHVGPESFAQIPEGNPDGRYLGDQVVLFRGQVYAQAKGGAGELRVITANARARVKRGSAIVVFRQDDEETQLVALDNESTLENRFETSRPVKAKAGEATTLNFRLLRVIPSTARAVSLAALRPRLEELAVPARERDLAVRSARGRQERVLATELVQGRKGGAHGGPDEKALNEKDERDAHGGGHAEKLAHESAQKHGTHAEGHEAARAPASVEARAPKPYVPRDPKSYIRHETDPGPSSDEARQQWVSRVVAGEKGGEKMLFPGRGPRAAKARVEVKDLEGKAPGKRPDPESEEKRRLIEELSRIREE